MKYTMYESQLDKYKSTAKGRRELKSIFGKKEATYDDFSLLALGLVGERCSGDLRVEAGKLVCMEKAWIADGAPVIFLEDASLVNSLYQARFDFSNGSSIESPFPYFSLSFPKSTYINGCELGSCLISITSIKDYVRSYSPITDTKEAEECISELMDVDELQIIIHYKDKNGGVYTTTRLISEITELPTDPDEESDILDVLLKIALTLCMYNSATDGEKLVKGYPEVVMKLPKGKSKISYQGLTLKSTNGCNHSKSTGKERRKIMHRIPYFRNLRALRFYQNEYKNSPPGSRWAFVKGIDIDGSMNTLMA